MCWACKLLSNYSYIFVGLLGFVLFVKTLGPIFLYFWTPKALDTL